MASKRTFLVTFVLIWAALFAVSFYMPSRIEGPRNLDTGFQRLDVFARYQILALGAAIVSAGLGVTWRREARRLLWLGLTPVIVTLILVAALTIATIFFGPNADQTGGPPRPAATVAE